MQWCARTGEPRGAVVPLRTVWDLAQVWYRTRLDADYRGRTTAEVAQIFQDLGLTSEFWALG